MIEITMARQHARAGTHNGRARGTVKAVSTVNRGRGDPVVKGGRPWRRHSDRERERPFCAPPKVSGNDFHVCVFLDVDCELFSSRIVQEENYNYSYLSRSIPIIRATTFESLGGRRREGKLVEEIPSDRKPGRCLWGPRRRPLSVNGAESSPSGRGGDGCQERISMTKGRWDAFSSLLFPREGPPSLNSNAMGVCYANIPIC